MQFMKKQLCVAIVGILYIPLSHANDASSTDVLLPTLAVKANKTSAQDSSEKTKAYTIENTSSATHLNLSVKETPQTINVVTRQQLDDFSLRTTRDILNNTPGVTVTGLETNRTTYTVHGFDISNILYDGMGIPQVDSYNYNNSDPDSYLFDRVEIIKGADALTNGLGDPGATINYVRKKPTKEFQASGGISYGSWDTQRYEADISGPLTQDGRVRARLVGYEKAGNSYLDKYSEEKNGVQLIVDADLTDSTTASVGYSRTNQLTNGSQWGALPLTNSAGQQLSYARSYNYAPSWTYYDWSINNYFASIEQKIAGDWVAKFNYDERISNLQNQMLYLSGNPSSTDNTSGIYLYPEIYNQKFRDRTFNLNTTGTYSLFGRRHEANIGYSWSQNVTQSNYAYGSSLGEYTTDLASWSPSAQTWGNSFTAPTTALILRSLYGATRLHLTDDLKVLLGVNYAEINSRGNYTKNKTLPYAGITYNFTPTYTGYVSYSSIFRPQTVIDSSTGKTAVPVEGKSYEMGVKSAWLNNKLTGYLSIFRTEQTNFALSPTFDLSDNLYHSQLGTVRSQGVDIGLAGKVTDALELSGGYTKFSLKNLANGVNPRQYNPTQTFNILATYTIPQYPKLKVGGSVKWQSAIHDPESVSHAGLITQDAYALIGLMTSYDVNKNLRLQLNVNNITNEKYLTGLKDGQGYYGEPTNYNLSVNFKF